MNQLEAISRPTENSNIPQFIRSMAVNLDLYIARHNAGLDPKPFRERQVTVFEAMRDFIKNGGTEGYVKLPTGVGKTVLFTKFIDATRVRTLIVTDRILGIKQTGEKLETFAEGLDVGKIYSGAKEFGRDVTITTYESLNINIENGKLKPEDFQLLILDEFDRAKSSKRTKTIKQFTNSVKLGFSATVPNETFLKEIHKMTIKEAVQEDLLCPFSVIIAQSDVDLTNVSVDSTGDYNEDQLEKAINIAKLNGSAVSLYKEMFEGQSALIYCAGIDHARKVSEVFIKSGIPAGFISGKNSPGEQRKILSQFKNGEIKILCSADILIRAYDEPRASVCLNLAPTSSPAIAEHRAGRVLRKNPNDPSKHAYIVDFFHKTGSTKCLPVSFAQVAESAHMATNTQQNKSLENAGRKTIPFKEKKDIGTSDKEIEISGLKIILDAEEVLRVVRKMQESDKKPELEGWMNRGALKNKLNLPSITGLAGRVEMESQGHPEWIKKVGEKIYLAPPLIERLFQYYSNLELPPEGWLTVHSIETTIKKRSSFLKRELEEEARPGEITEGLSNKGIIRAFFAPELVDRVRKKISEIEPAHEGEITAYAFGEIANIDPKAAKEIAKSFEKEHPEKVKMSLDLTRRPRKHYPLQELEQILKAREEWITINAFKRKFHIPNNGSLEKRIAIESKMHPDWFIRVGKNRTYLTQPAQEFLGKYFSEKRRVGESRLVEGVTV